MKSSPAICQLYVSQAFQNVPNDVLLVNYTGNILRSQPDAQYVKSVSLTLLEDLATLNLQMPLQSSSPFSLCFSRILHCLTSLVFQSDIKGPIHFARAPTTLRLY